MWPQLTAIEEARQVGTGRGVKVAILDTGVEVAHERLRQARFSPPRVITSTPHRISVSACSGIDVCGHGTGIAGIIHALAPEAEILSIRVLDTTAQQRRPEAIKLAAQYALHHGAQILNCSFGVPCAGFALPHYKEWTDRAFALDRHVVGAASNECPDVPEWPAYFPQVIATTARELPPDELTYLPEHMVSFAAAGIDVEVLCPGGETSLRTGSSFAAAHLSGILARLLSQFPHWSPSFAFEALRRISTPDGQERAAQAPLTG